MKNQRVWRVGKKHRRRRVLLSYGAIPACSSSLSIVLARKRMMFGSIRICRLRHLLLLFVRLLLSPGRNGAHPVDSAD